MRVSGAICKVCGVFVYTRTKDDVRTCPGNHMIVGKPVKVREAILSWFSRPVHPPVGTPGDGFYRAADCSDMHMGQSFVAATGDVRATPEALHYDWNNNINKFGIIPAPAYRDFNVVSIPYGPPVPTPKEPK